MKFGITFLLIILLVSCGGARYDRDPELEALYVQLDEEISKAGEYEVIKEARINKLHKDYDFAHTREQRTDLINRLIEEYESYNADSALYYISYNLRRLTGASDSGECIRLLVKRADVYAHAGLFSDALEILRSIPRESVSEDILESYYSTYCATYQYLSEYAGEHEPAYVYENLRESYADSLKSVIPPGSFNHLVYVMSGLARRGDSEKAIDTLLTHMEDYPSGTREYSILASTLAYIYKTAGFPREAKRFLVLSAISDVKAAIKENVSFREVATEMFEDGDVERANRYLKKSIADANFYSALMRNAQSAKMLPVIDDAYTNARDTLTVRMRVMARVSAILSIILIVAILFMLKQFRSLRRANMQVNKANDDLQELSEQLRSANRELEQRNDELRDYNRTKEQYAGLFMENCSTAISTLQQYQQSLRVLAAGGGNLRAVLKKLESSEIADQLLKNFYVKFDEAILNIYPSFVNKFNALLRPESRIQLKSGELLNTELRLFALIRVGIDDSAKIAGFLRCSITTVYTYRSKIRKRALAPETFENDVRAIV
ncbi:MAG: hypothetical protein K2I69_05980 [Muribaculaceae bacterium]|nr:hypothetical protein [Muribaculaceae bacterium]